MDTLEFNWKYKEYEIRAVPKSLVRVDDEDVNETIELVQWIINENPESSYCYTLAYWVYNDYSGYSLKFVGNRPFRDINGSDLLKIWEQLRVAQKNTRRFIFRRYVCRVCILGGNDIKAIKTKHQSDYVIKQLNLNRMLEGVFTNKDSEGLVSFLSKHQYPYYNIRDKSTSMGRFLYQLTADEIIRESQSYNAFSVYESLAEADKRLVLQGDIEIDKDFNLVASLSDIKGISNRQAMENPKYHLQLNLKEKREPPVRGLTEIIDYIVAHELFGVIVEFSLFDIPVGIHKENIIIWELRNY